MQTGVLSIGTWIIAKSQRTSNGLRLGEKLPGWFGAIVPAMDSGYRRVGGCRGLIVHLGMGSGVIGPHRYSIGMVFFWAAMMTAVAG